MTKKSTTTTSSRPRFNTVLDYIRTCSVEGLTQVMIDIANHDATWTPEQIAQLDAVVEKDNIAEAAARLSAAEESGLGAYVADVQPLVTASTFEESKRYIHAVDLRIKALPAPQQTELWGLFNGAAFGSMLATVPVADDGGYGMFADADGDGDDVAGDL